MQNQQVNVLLQQLQLLYPAAFKHNYLFYSQIKTRGVLDDRREFIPWLLASMIFIPISFVLKDILLSNFEISNFQAHAYAILAILLFLMLVIPLIIKQIRHSSHSLYQLLRHSPVKLAAVVVLSALNIEFLQSQFVMWALLFFGVSFGFVRFYKENLFRQNSQDDEYYQLHQLRRVCFWAYKQSLKTRLKLYITSAKSPEYEVLKRQLNRYADLYSQLFKSEHQYCKRIKHIDVDSYLDEVL
ncbi:hypothetical protein BS636_09370 [Acinetobacter sp. LoGeW2-3]|uniref:hypothetical protein n=1 Tax=Acinetobacter sp. LoGeW2-3 TaxID=1808001 RepID=UPI000C059E1F|nr:hypothetical protein [Acinetobacter sp. LoGeW2-3]ATO19842.1 hypothetical protein BS636_09370 [Acinetobacter sp. LoGeW2-3]